MAPQPGNLPRAIVLLARTRYKRQEYCERLLQACRVTRQQEAPVFDSCLHYEVLGGKDARFRGSRQAFLEETRAISECQSAVRMDNDGSISGSNDKQPRQVASDIWLPTAVRNGIHSFPGFLRQVGSVQVARCYSTSGTDSIREDAAASTGASDLLPADLDLPGVVARSHGDPRVSTASLDSLESGGAGLAGLEGLGEVRKSDGAEPVQVNTHRPMGGARQDDTIEHATELGQSPARVLEHPGEGSGHTEESSRTFQPGQSAANLTHTRGSNPAAEMDWIDKSAAKSQSEVSDDPGPLDRREKDAAGQINDSGSPHSKAAAKGGRLEGKLDGKRTKKKVKERTKKYIVHPMDPQSLWAELAQRIETKKHYPITSAEKDRLVEIFQSFRDRGWAADQALALYINSKFFPVTAARFKKIVMRAITPQLKESLLAFGKVYEAEAYLFPLYAEFCFNEFPTEITAYRELVNSADMTKPYTWYPFARAMKRKVIYHRGPTNSGKTYTALKRFREAKSGIYCGPLRLLAMEVYDTVNIEGVYCNLVTGQERKMMPFAEHTACTIEMANLSQTYEVAVVDEIQMITDEYRGWAWTRALLGLQADEIHVCGDSSALPLLRQLAAQTGDEFVDYEYERFKPLRVDQRSLRGDFRNVQPGDCIVAFSRREIFDIKRQVETMTSHRCCVVYGALPPETRRQQAKLFNDPASGYDVLVASDAVGMGLNLNIRRVVFFSLTKFNGEEKALIPPPMVKQIAGRAGRRGSLYPEGIATSFNVADMAPLLEGLQRPVEPAAAAGLFPFFEQVELFASQLPDATFTQLLGRFVETSRVDGSYFLCKTDNLRHLANMLEKVHGLSLEDRFKFCFAPCNTRDPEAMASLLRYAGTFAERKPVTFSLASPPTPFSDEMDLMNLETKHQVASLYMWLSQHFPSEFFPHREYAQELASGIAGLLAASLARPSSPRQRPEMSNKGSKYMIKEAKNEYYLKRRDGRRDLREGDIDSRKLERVE